MNLNRNLFIVLIIGFTLSSCISIAFLVYDVVSFIKHKNHIKNIIVDCLFIVFSISIDVYLIRFRQSRQNAVHGIAGGSEVI